ncbi:MAG: hypothetical protein IJ787_00170, partial [Bacilli bacterium]|nr:hypothetical protein [Bacilli bacterium]
MALCKDSTSSPFEPAPATTSNPLETPAIGGVNAFSSIVGARRTKKKALCLGLLHNVPMPKENAEQQERKVIDVFPLPKGKRMLVFLADFFISFILGLALFHLVAYPLSRLFTNADAQAEQLISSQKHRDETLYGNKLLFYGETSDQQPASFS